MSSNQIFRFREHLPVGNVILIISQRCKNTQQQMLLPQALQYVVAIATKYEDLYGLADWIVAFIWIVKQTNTIHIILIYPTRK